MPLSGWELCTPELLRETGDYNFDGHLDYRLPSETPGNQCGWWNYFIFDVSIGHHRAVEASFCKEDFDSVKSWSRPGSTVGMAGQIYAIRHFRWEGFRLVPVFVEAQEYDAARHVFIRTKVSELDTLGGPSVSSSLLTRDEVEAEFEASLATTDENYPFRQYGIEIQPLKEEFKYGCGCAFHMPIGEKGIGALLLQWLYEEPAQIRLNGVLRNLKIENAEPSNEVVTPAVGDSKHFLLGGDGVGIRIQCATMSVCPPDSTECESIHQGMMTIQSGSDKAIYPVRGGCGCRTTVALAVRALPLLLLLYCGASLLHFVHNAEFIADYPNLPLWISRKAIYFSWFAIFAIGLCGYLLYRGRYAFIGLVLMAIYATLWPLDGLLHYSRAPLAADSAGMNATIWIEVVTALTTLAAVSWITADYLRRPTRCDPGV